MTGLAADWSGLVLATVDAPEGVGEFSGLVWGYTFQARDVLKAVQHQFCELHLFQTVAVLVDDELDQFDGLTFGEVFH